MRSTRKGYGDFLVESKLDLVVLDADLSAATCSNEFAKLNPNKHINVGIAEQDLIGTASGISVIKEYVFASSFAMFLCGRAYEQIRNTIGYSNLNVNLIGTHTGLAVGEDGATHQCIEDISLMGNIPNMTVFCPSDYTSTKKILNLCLNIHSPKYIRLGRNETEDIYNENDIFELGKSKVHGKGLNATIFATGNTVSIALKAKDILSKKNIDVRVVDIYSIKPIDKKTIIKCAKETDILISIEDHLVSCGIGSCISNVLTEFYPKRLYKLGVKDKFGKSGTMDKLYEMYNITEEDIINIFK
ncbi:MAG: transketolase C-terminal domain-containing protein [Clostridia bacterium]